MGGFNPVGTPNTVCYPSGLVTTPQNTFRTQQANFSHNLPVSLNNKDTAKSLKLNQVEHACSQSEAAAGCLMPWFLDLGLCNTCLQADFKIVILI